MQLIFFSSYSVKMPGYQNCWGDINRSHVNSTEGCSSTFCMMEIVKEISLEKQASLSERSLKTTYLVQSLALLFEDKLKVTFQFPLGVSRFFLRWVLPALRLSFCLGKYEKLLKLAPLLTRLEKRMSSIIDLENSDSTVP